MLLRHCLFVCIWGMVLPCVGLADSKSDGTDKALEVLTESFNSRKEITSFNAKVHARYSEDGISFSEREYHFIRDGEKQRFFFDLPLLSEEYGNCFSEDKNLLAILRIGSIIKSLKTSQNPKVQIDMQRSDSLDVEQTSSQLVERHWEVVFPQFEYFGYSPRTILNFRYGDFSNMVQELIPQLQQPTNSLSMSRITVYSLPMVEIRLEALHGNNPRKHTQRYWFDPSKKLFPIFVEQFTPLGQEGDLVSTTSTTPALHTESGCWYPAKWTYERRENGKITKKEEASVELISLNEPIDPALFTLKGLERLKPDTRVNWLASSPKPPAEGTLLWNGEEIVGGLPGRGLSEPMPRSNRRLIIVMVNVVILSWILGIHFYRQYRRSHK